MIAASRRAIAFSLEDLPDEVLMALSKKQMKKVKKAIKKGKIKISGVEDFNDEPHFGGEVEDDQDDTYKDEGNDAFDNGCDSQEENEDMLSPSRKTALSLSGSVLDAVRDARRIQIDQLAATGHITAAAKKGMIERFINSPAVAFSNQYDDGFNSTVELLKANGRVLPMGKSGPQITGAIALSQGESGEQNVLIADADRRKEGKTNF